MSVFQEVVKSFCDAEGSGFARLIIFKSRPFASVIFILFIQ